VPLTAANQSATSSRRAETDLLGFEQDDVHAQLDEIQRRG
jgi:hypothetical protein